MLGDFTYPISQGRGVKAELLCKWEGTRSPLSERPKHQAWFGAGCATYTGRDCDTATRLCKEIWIHIFCEGLSSSK